MQLLDQHAGNTTPEQLGMLVMSTVAPSTKWNSSAIPMCTAILPVWKERSNPESASLDAGRVQHMDSPGVGASMELTHRLLHGTGPGGSGLLLTGPRSARTTPPVATAPGTVSDRLRSSAHETECAKSVATAPGTVSDRLRGGSDRRIPKLLMIEPP